VSEASGRRILVVLHEPGYFRMYGSMIVELDRRGWEVLLAFDNPGKRGGARQTPPHTSSRTVSLGGVPISAAAAERPIARLRGAFDYARYLEPAFADADYLRHRAVKSLPDGYERLTKVGRVPRVVMTAAIRAMRALERCTAVDPAVLEFVRDAAARAVFVSPLVNINRAGNTQTEVVKAARALRVPVIVGAASWDHLTSKGMIRVVPDALTVWNDAQVNEAVRLHRIPRERIVVTGAQSLDHWFQPVDEAAVEEYRRSIAVRPGQRLLLFVGSSRNMAPGESEVRFVRRWLAALRRSSSAVLRDAKVVIRPHPTNTEPWRDVSLGDPDAIVDPATYSGIPLTVGEVEAFRRQIAASAAVIGVNTTAMIEAAIAGRPVLTVEDAEFTHSQAQTLHFAHLPVAAGGCAISARDIETHATQLEEVLRDPAPAIAAARAFVAAFVRPRGMLRSATDWLCDAIEAQAGSPVHIAAPRARAAAV
jgi:hypothetical protein